MFFVAPPGNVVIIVAEFSVLSPDTAETSAGHRCDRRFADDREGGQRPAASKILPKVSPVYAGCRPMRRRRPFCRRIPAVTR